MARLFKAFIITHYSHLTKKRFSFLQYRVVKQVTNYFSEQYVLHTSAIEPTSNKQFLKTFINLTCYASSRNQTCGLNVGKEREEEKENLRRREIPLPTK